MALRALILIAVLATAGAYARALEGRRAAPGSIPDLASLPRELPGWTSVDAPMDEGAQEALAADETLLRRYEHVSGAQVWLFLAYFREQQVGSQIHSPRNCVPGSGWSVRDLRQQAVALGDRSRLAQVMTLERQDHRQTMLYWFRTQSGTVTGEYGLKWDLVRNSLRGRPTNAVFVRFTSPEGDAPMLQDLAGRLEAPMDGLLGPVGIR